MSALIQQIAPSVGIWDILLLVVVSTQATALAYVYAPKWKAFILLLPFPFTLSTLAVGTGVDVTPVVGLILLLLFMHAVRLLYRRLGLPIISAIVLPAVGYCILGTLLARILPRTDSFFWTAFACVYALGIVLVFSMPYREEPGHKTPLPVWNKLPIIVAVILMLILMKKSMQGFITMFPMVGLITVFEARHSLWTICRQIPVLMLTILPLMAVCQLLQNSIGLGGALAVGWVIFGLMLTLVLGLRGRRDARNAAAAGVVSLAGRARIPTERGG